MGTVPQFVATPRIGAQTIENADGTTVLDVFTAGSSGSRLQALWATHDDTAGTVIVKLYLHDGTEAHLLGTVSVPAATAGTPLSAADFLQAAPWAGPEPTLLLPTGWKVQAGLAAAITSGKKCSVVAMGGDF